MHDNSGWVKLHRKIRESSMYKSLNSKQRDVLMQCLMMANHEENEWEFKGEIFKCKPGQFITSLSHIAKKCAHDVKIQSVRTCLLKFGKWQFLTNESTSTGRLITICKWDTYQCGEESTNKETNKRLTNDQQTTNKRLTTNKNDKEDKENKEVKNNTICSEPDKVPVSKQVQFDYDTGLFTGISEQILQLWYKAYPAVEVDNSIDRAGLWLIANPTKRKKNYFRFLTNWMSKGQERGGSAKSVSADKAAREQIIKNLTEKYDAV